MTTVRTVLAMRTKEGCEQRFEAEWLSIAEKIRTLDGCLRQDLVRDVDDPRSFLIISDWTDRGRLDAFGRSEYREQLLQVIRELRESAQRHTYQVLHTVRDVLAPEHGSADQRGPRDRDTADGRDEAGESR